MTKEKIKNIIEAALMVSTKPLSINMVLSLFESEQSLQPERNDIREALETLQEDYSGRGIELAEIASGFRVQARMSMHHGLIIYLMKDLPVTRVRYWKHWQSLLIDNRLHAGK